MYGDIEKVIFVGNNVTKEKKMEFESEKQSLQLMLQEEKLKAVTRVSGKTIG